MRAVRKLSLMKNLKANSRVCWTKITIIYNVRDVYQTKDIQPWSESLKSVQVWVIEKSYNCVLAHCSCKTTAENFDRHVTDVVGVKIIFDKNSIIVPLSLLWLPWHQFEVDVWTENILASDSSSESPRPPWWFFVADKESSRLQSVGLKYSTPSWIFRKDGIVQWR